MQNENLNSTLQALKLGPTLKVAVVWMFQFHRHTVELQCLKHLKVVICAKYINLNKITKI